MIALPVYGNGDTYPLRYDAVVANDAVPNNEPVIPLVTLSDPVIVELFWAISPFLAMNSCIYIVLCFTVHRGGFHINIIENAILIQANFMQYYYNLQILKLYKHDYYKLYIGH